MKCTILHESRGRLRVHVCNVRMTLHRADVLEAYLNHHDAVSKAKVYERTGDVVVYYTGSRKDAVTALSTYRFDDPELDALVTSADSRRINQEYQEKMYNLLAGRVLRELFLPAPLNAAYTVFRSIEFLWKGVCCLWRRKLEVEVLDALSIGVSILRGDFATAGSVMFLLNVGSLLEEWTRKKSLDDLARSMALNVDKVWVRAQGTEVLMPLTKVHPGDEIVVRSGNMIPLDGTVIEGEAMVNQSALTGESMPVRKTIGATVYAGTVVEEGECVLTTKAEGGANRYDKIVAMIEESEKLKSSTENRALALADRLVPWCLGATVVTYALTRNATRAISCLMVDFSCALKLSMPLAVLSAMRECGASHITVKGGKYLETLSKADTIVFDKTGTLTRATPKVVRVVPFSNCSESEVCSWPPASRSTSPTRWPMLSSGRPKSAASPTKRCTPRWSISWPTASPAASAVSGSSSAATTSSLRTSTAPSPRTSARSSITSSRSILTSIWPLRAVWPASSASPTRCVRKLPACCALCAASASPTPS